MNKMRELWYQTRDKKYSMKDHIKTFFWVVRYPFLTVRLAHFAVKVLVVSGMDIKETYRRD